MVPNKRILLCSINYPETDNLKSLRELLKNKIKVNFKFLDEDGNKIDEDDEEYFKLGDFFQNNIIKLKLFSNLIIDEEELYKNNISSIPSEINKNYEVIRKQEDIVIYKYSNIERESNYPLVYQYFYDTFEIDDYKNAYVMLFVGKTGDGKSTAINALFNIIKGIKLEDKYRFILIKEKEKEKGQAVSQTDGVHLYYIKDYKNNPIIIIDTQGYGDTRGILFDKKIDEAFRYVFSNIINHINVVGMIVKATNNRIDVLTKYIFSCITKLFAGDISENVILLATHANRDCIKKEPIFAETIKTEVDFLEKKDKKWWYAFDSTLMFESDIDKLTTFSFSQLKDFYEEKLCPKDIKQTFEIFHHRRELKKLIKKIKNIFQSLKRLQNNMNSNDTFMNETIRKITEYNNLIVIKKETINTLERKEKEEEEKLYSSNFRTYRRYDIMQKTEEIRKEREKHIQSLNELEIQLRNMESLKNIKTKENEGIKNNMRKITKKIIFDIKKLQKTFQLIDVIALNNNHNEMEIQYIDLLIEEINKTQYDKKELQKLKNYKQNNHIFQDLSKLNLEEKDLKEMTIKISNILFKN